MIILNESDKVIRRFDNLDSTISGSYTIAKTTKNVIIQTIVNLNYVPIKAPTVWKLVRYYQKHNKLRYLDWKASQTSGRKPVMARSTLCTAIDEYKKATEGGESVSKASLCKKINHIIKKEWQENYGSKYKHRLAPEATTRKYIDKISGVRKFNTYKNVSNKTESRRAAEFSIRSTISYAMAVLCSHYIKAKPSKFHIPKNILEKDPVYTLIRDMNRRVLGITASSDIEHF